MRKKTGLRTRKPFNASKQRSGLIASGTNPKQSARESIPVANHSQRTYKHERVFRRAEGAQRPTRSCAVRRWFHRVKQKQGSRGSRPEPREKQHEPSDEDCQEDLEKAITPIA